MSGPNLSGYTVQEARQPCGFTAEPRPLVVVRSTRELDNPAPNPRAEVINLKEHP